MTGDEFWLYLRELRAGLEAGGESALASALFDAVSGSTVRQELSAELVACLQKLRASEAASQLGLQSLLDALEGSMGDTTPG